MTGISSEAVQAREQGLNRGLSQRLLTMIGIGGAVGHYVRFWIPRLLVRLPMLASGLAGPLAIAVTMVLAGGVWRLSVFIGAAWLALTVIAFALRPHIRNAS